MKIFLAALIAACSYSVSAATITATANLDYAQEFEPSNPIPSTATGTATILFDDVANTLDISASIDGIFLSDITFPIGSGLEFGAIGPFHIHLGAVGVNGPPQVVFEQESFFSASPTGLDVSANDIAFDPGLIANLLDGNLYLNLHSLDYGSGEIRGQLSAVPVPLPLMLLMVPLGILARFKRNSLSL